MPVKLPFALAFLQQRGKIAKIFHDTRFQVWHLTVPTKCTKNSHPTQLNLSFKYNFDSVYTDLMHPDRQNLYC